MSAQVVVVGLREFPVDSVDVLKQLIEESGNKRSTGSTAANADSSRSHSIMQFALKAGGPEGRLVGKISFIDLAGSERGADTFDNNRQVPSDLVERKLPPAGRGTDSKCRLRPPQAAAHPHRQPHTRCQVFGSRFCGLDSCGPQPWLQ